MYLCRNKTKRQRDNEIVYIMKTEYEWYEYLYAPTLISLIKAPIVGLIMLVCLIIIKIISKKNKTK